VQDLKESDLARHLEENAPEDASEESAAKSSLVAEDFQLAEALNVLRGLNILGRIGNP
jgi:carboxyl-terminal processing protease